MFLTSTEQDIQGVLTVFHAVRCPTANTDARRYSDHDGTACCQETSRSPQFHGVALLERVLITGVLSDPG